MPPFFVLSHLGNGLGVEGEWAFLGFKEEEWDILIIFKKLMGV